MKNPQGIWHGSLGGKHDFLTVGLAEGFPRSKAKTTHKNEKQNYAKVQGAVYLYRCAWVQTPRIGVGIQSAKSTPNVSSGAVHRC